MITTDELRRTLGPLGIWMPPPARIGIDPESYAREIEAARFTSVWYPGMNSPADLAAVEPALEAAGQAYVKPYAKMVRFLDEVPATSAPVILAALGPKMLALSRDRAAGAHPYFSPPEH